MAFSVKECAKLSKLSTRTIQNYIKNGKLSASRDKDGNYTVNEAEFYRVFPDETVTKVDESKRNFDENSGEKENVMLKLEVKNLNNEIRLLNKQIDLLAHQLEQYQARENKLLAMADSTTKLLTHEKTNKKRKWFGR